MLINNNNNIDIWIRSRGRDNSISMSINIGNNYNSVIRRNSSSSSSSTILSGPRVRILRGSTPLLRGRGGSRRVATTTMIGDVIYPPTRKINTGRRHRRDRDNNSSRCTAASRRRICRRGVTTAIVPALPAASGSYGMPTLVIGEGRRRLSRPMTARSTSARTRRIGRRRPCCHPAATRTAT